MNLTKSISISPNIPKLQTMEQHQHLQINVAKYSWFKTPIYINLYRFPGFGCIAGGGWSSTAPPFWRPHGPCSAGSALGAGAEVRGLDELERWIPEIKKKHRNWGNSRQFTHCQWVCVDFRITPQWSPHLERDLTKYKKKLLFDQVEFAFRWNGQTFLSILSIPKCFLRGMRSLHVNQAQQPAPFRRKNFIWGLHRKILPYLLKGH